MRIHFLQHVPFEGPAPIIIWAREHRYPVTYTRLFKKEPLPPLAAFDALVIMGGPMSVHDENQYPWLLKEKHFIEKAITRGKRLFGICLGAQLIAHVLGARVRKNSHREIGWYPVRLTQKAQEVSLIFHDIPQIFPALHWHGETFDIPQGSLYIGRTTACRNQGFIYNDRVIAFQFHIEATPKGIAALIKNCGAQLSAGPFVQTPEQLLKNCELRTRCCNHLLNRMLETWTII
ncbi:MAG: hypothetical protein A2487_00275 [Candidatus Raymondbacteria bacterium RifOxyC12_full_50_8]|uniref:Glutamine amidotransferase domain-containing protein n=1 Tax=Candidatus Raymondbacteria bacterium RIFOXYD12_FULL_49_13 TaxID=1817890 RepID=A0A1F7FL95_UNCRA|nr:MAG: hypothetical protein A2248_08785 [Candidatus Raymondbacteria bacterium RIFOXYA2_FULL_49_16]OGK07489.1 MAG: hypothetical protein A2519_20230 [Candidatus Raymondbacteria bacterium RIFOXYD12_FULL_49_13]OGK07774.1 MAG: hypothetical protein A2487_00275 [Candidatus Raymondbacteria bacterium RifOxyC12_full_50_8]OGP43845.1 MAG: hypothetical protein A2324_01460 [Candidatus Raymondbacteria bacterium RIFOXYB2_FULL_49_35]